ncbi:MAG: ABC transporter substrate-binding protein [Pseudomonadales bacterium]|nr:ABC transporter substrate-binding protein [Pseudomonadales bacterium]
MMNKSWVKGFLLALLVWVAPWSLADDSPVSIVTATSEAVRAALLKENGSNGDAVRADVEKLIYARFDFNRMTALAVGKYWRDATPEQKTALSNEFRTLLSRTYYTTMLRYRDVKLNVRPEPLLENDGKQATVKTDVTVGNAQQPVMIDYVLYQSDAGWKVFNVNVEGASLVTVYRNQFADEINKGGMAGLIQTLQAKNAQPPQS